MLRIQRIVCAVMICAMVGVALGAARKIKTFEAFAPESALADGMAIINHAAGVNKTVAQVILSDFTAGQSYVVIIGAAGPMIIDRTTFTSTVVRVDLSRTMSAGQGGSLVTDDKGNLTVHLSTAAGEGNQFFDSVAVVTEADWDARVPTPFGTQHIITLSAAGGAFAPPPPPS